MFCLGAPLACVPFQRLETAESTLLLNYIGGLLSAADAAVAVLRSNEQMQALLSIIGELETRINFLYCST